MMNATIRSVPSIDIDIDFTLLNLFYNGV